ncbi:MAG: hypothetical protein LBQ31_09825 [Bacteroidales bacterium]|jgi:hypothetical protein|nr:hypothetical protein [Bacteroidales bacterium]
MKNKKVILGMLLAMVMSLGVLNGISSKKEASCSQQAAVVCLYYSAAGEDLTNEQRGGLAVAGAVCGEFAKGLGKCAIGLGWCPAGWIFGIGTAVAAL